MNDDRFRMLSIAEKARTGAWLRRINRGQTSPLDAFAPDV